MHRRSTTTLLAIVAALSLTATASAATVRMERVVERDEGQTTVYGTVAIAAAAGETNTLAIGYTRGAGDDPDELLVTDATAALVAGERCQQVNANTVRCRDAGVGDILEVAADLGDMDDRARSAVTQQLGDLVIVGGPGNDDLSGTWARLEGGPGDDRLTGASGRENLAGDAGNDVLEGHDDIDYLDGGPGNDVLRGGAGPDNLYAGGSAGDPAPAGRDTLDGGPGADTLSDQDELGDSKEIGPDILVGGEGSDYVASYIGRSAAVRVDLTKTEGQGQTGENDTIEGVEHASGGDRGDMLVGNDAANDLDGGKGRDLMRGGGGDDRLRSTVNPAETRENGVARRYGPDTVFGDAGDDAIETLPTMESTISCGPGDDAVSLPGFARDKAQSSLGPLVSRTCERLAMSGSRSARTVTVDPFPVAVTRDSVVFRLLRFRCCAQVMQIHGVARPRTRLASARLRRQRLSLDVGRNVIRASRRTPVLLRGKITKVNVNRFVWRFELGRGGF